MVSLLTAIRYTLCRAQYASTVVKNYRLGYVTHPNVYDFAWKNFFLGKLTCLVPANKSIVLIRKLQLPDTSHVSVGDVVALKDPENSGAYIFRQLAAIEGHEVSKGKKEEPLVLEKDKCWVLTCHDKVEAKDSRSFGPVSMSSIVGRVIYSFRSADDHGPMKNSHISIQKDKPILEMELDVDDMVEAQKIMKDKLVQKPAPEDPTTTARRKHTLTRKTESCNHRSQPIQNNKR